MQLRLILTTLCIGLASFSFAQTNQRTIKKATPVVNTTQQSTSKSNSGATTNSRSPQFSTSSVASTQNQSLLQELYAIEDQRNSIEKDHSISSTERGNLIIENNSAYSSKKTEFVIYINSKGILNVSKQEQSYFLSILKTDNNLSEYNKNIELIKHSNKWD